MTDATDATDTREVVATALASQPIALMISSLGFAVARGFKQVLRPVGLEPRQFAMLRHVEAHEGRSQQSIGDALQIPASRMVALVDELEERGLLERRRSPDDRRAHALHLTAKGASLLSKAVALAIRFDESVVAVLTRDDRKRLRGLLERLSADQRLVAGVHPGMAHPGEEGWSCE